MRFGNRLGIRVEDRTAGGEQCKQIGLKPKTDRKLCPTKEAEDDLKVET